MPYDNVPQNKWAEMDRCVESVMGQGHDKPGAIAICYASIMKSEPEKQIVFGSTAKALGNGKIGGYLVLFSPDGTTDLDGDYFDANTNFGDNNGNGQPVMIGHGIPFQTSDEKANDFFKSVAKRLLPAMTTRKDELGIYAEVILNLADEYEKTVYGLAEKGAWKWSSGAVPQSVIRDGAYIKQWVIGEGSLTPTPAEPRMLQHRVLPVKSLAQGAAYQSSPQPVVKTHSTKKGLIKMATLLERAKILVPGLSAEQLTALTAFLEMAGVSDMAEMPDETMMSADEAQIEKSLGLPLAKVKELAAQLRQPVKAVNRPVFDPNPQPAPTADAPEVKSAKAAYVTRFGDEDSTMKGVMTDLLGKDYQQKIYEQENVFERYMRFGEKRLDSDEIKMLDMQIFHREGILDLLKNGKSVSGIKTVMVEAQGGLGGYAVPPSWQSQFITRLPGMTAVRGAGATVIQLNSSNSIEIPEYDGGDDQYVGAIRGAWGTETQSPAAKNATLKMVSLLADIYTYKVQFSQSLADDAANFVSLVQRDILDVLATDEDNCFLTGDGVGKPLGIIPGSANTLGLTEVHSGAAATVTAAGIKLLKRGVASQYRRNGTFVANSSTFGAVEALTVSTASATYAFPDLSETAVLLGQPVKESEALPDLAASSLSMIFGDFSGYYIAERLGMTIVRFQDSNTGINQMEYQVRRRVGGRVAKPWMFALLSTEVA